MEALLSRSMKLNYIRGFIICKQNMATKGVNLTENLRPSADPTVSNISLFSLSILGVRRLA